MTEKPDNHLMWVHYAAQHRGFVIGFHSSSRFLSPEGGLLGEVKYERAPEDICPPVLECALYKEEEWRYEKEWTCVRSDNEPDSYKYIDFNPGDVAEVIVGSQMEEHHVMTILSKLEGVSQYWSCRAF
jgi:hypothetical protein